MLILSMVVMCMATAHGGQGHGEGFEVFRLEFKNILALFKVVNGHRRAGRAFAIGERQGFLGLNKSVIAVVVLVVLTVLVFVVSVLFMLAFVVFVMLVFIVLRHSQVVGTVFSMEFVCFFSVLSEKVDVCGARRGEVAAQVTDQHGFEIKRFFARRHGVGGGRRRSVGSHRVDDVLNPRLQTKAVIQEHVGSLETNDVLCRGFVIVNRDVGRADHFDVDEVTTNRRNEFSDVVGRDHHGAVSVGGFATHVFCVKAASEAGEDHHQACSQGALPRFAHGCPSGINYLV